MRDGFFRIGTDGDMGYIMTENLKTGNNTIDREHQELFETVNQLLDACNRGDAITLLRPTIEFLLDHVTEHFKHEEQLQEQAGYPNIEEHRAFHKKYKKDLKKILLQIPFTGPTITDIINLNGLAAALVNHVKTDDRKMCDFLRKKR